MPHPQASPDGPHHTPKPPPTAPTTPAKPTPWRPIKAVLLGLLVDIGGTTLMELFGALVYAIKLYIAGIQDEVLSKALGQIHYDSGFVVYSLIVGTIFSALGGYVCGRVAREAGRRAGQVLGGLVILYGGVVSIDIYPIPVFIGLSLCAWAAVTMGVTLGMNRAEPVRG
jgi:TM2 domain-containing membrane protein YozV